MLSHLSPDDQRSATAQLRAAWKEVLANAGFVCGQDDGTAQACLWTHPLSLHTFTDPYTPASLFAAVRARLSLTGHAAGTITPSTYRVMQRLVGAMAWDQVISWKLAIEEEAASRLTGKRQERIAGRETYRGILWNVGAGVAPHRAR